MSRTDELLELEPFSLADQEKLGPFSQALKESLIHHYENCEGFRKLCDKRGFNPSGDFSVEDVPFLPVGIFKTLKLTSVPESMLSSQVQSSSTSGVPSQIYLDDITSRRQRSALNRILSSFIGSGRKAFVIFDSEHTVRSRDGSLSSRATAIRGMLPFMKQAFYILDRDLNLDKEALRNLVYTGARYIGMIGSRRKVRAVMEELRQEGVDRELLDSVHAPIGMDIGAETPVEIAISILSEMVHIKRKGANPVQSMKAGMAKDMSKDVPKDIPKE